MAAIAPAPESVRWSKRRWAWTILLVFVFHLLFIAAFSNFERVTVVAHPQEANIRMLRQPLPPALAEFWNLNDPTLFALARPHGFAQQAWTNLHPVEYQPTPWIEPPVWLELTSNSFGAEFEHYLAENPPALPQIPDRLALEIGAPADGALWVRNESQVRIDANGALLPLRSLPPLPLIPAAEPLTNSLVRIMVGRAGETLSAVLLFTSGSKEADQIALDYARGLQLDWKDSRSSLNPPCANLIFQWATAPLASRR